MDRHMEEILDTCLEKMREGEPLEEILMKYPEDREGLKNLLGIAKAIKNIPSPQVREEALTSCLAKVRQAVELREKRTWRTRWPRLPGSRLFYLPSPAWAKALALVLIISFISWGAVSLSADSFPGDLLYPVKLMCEKIEYSLTTHPEGRAKLRLIYSEERMEELLKFLDKKRELNVQVLQAMLDEAALVMDNIPRLPKDRGIVYCLKLEHLVAYQRDVLEGLKSKVPLPQRQELDHAIQTCHHRHLWMGKVIKDEAPIGRHGPFTLNEN
jgi:hypothetical protein